MENQDATRTEDGDILRRMFSQKKQSRDHGVFSDKALLDPSRPPGEIVGREKQFRRLVDYLADLETGYLPPLIQVYGPPGTGKSTVVRMVASEATRQFPDLRVVDVNLKECRSLFTAANQILFQVAGVKEPPVSGLDGVFEKLWAAVEDTKYLVLILDEIDAIFQDRRYNPSDFLYRLVRRRETQRPPLVGLVTITNVLMGIDSLLDSRVRSSVGTQSVYFPPYQEKEMAAILRRRLGAFKPDAVAYDTVSECATFAASEHGDARRALDLLRTAGELADRAGSEIVEMEHVDRAYGILDSERAHRVIWDLPAQEVVVLMALNYLQFDGHEETVTTGALFTMYLEQCGFWGLPARGKRRFLEFLQDLEMHGLIGSKVDSTGRHGRRKFIWTQADLLEVRGAAFGYLQEHYRSDLGFPVSRPPTEDI
ncbi:MAG: AAA family ATPase [Thermoplasmata archaeon]